MRQWECYSCKNRRCGFMTDGAGASQLSDGIPDFVYAKQCPCKENEPNWVDITDKIMRIY